ncbi:MAG: hypothetical protein HC919_07705 [Oscillatoriales cyanobacterium SM2_2_1]|nr:hypothetical protein [Oscillatoriales cyanobacterium SM2_2_1]
MDPLAAQEVYVAIGDRNSQGRSVLMDIAPALIQPSRSTEAPPVLEQAKILESKLFFPIYSYFRFI